MEVIKNQIIFLALMNLMVLFKYQILIEATTIKKNKIAKVE